MVQFQCYFFVPNAKVIEVIESICHGCGACSYACNDEAITEKPLTLGTVTSYMTDKNNPLIEARLHVNEISTVRVINAAIKESGDEGWLSSMRHPEHHAPLFRR